MVAAIGGVVMTSAVKLIVNQQRTQTTLVGRETVQESLRTGLSVLLAELREVSPGEGDMVAFSSDSITIRAARSLGFVCDLVRGTSPSLNVRQVGAQAVATDSFTVLAANRPGQYDDVWLRGSPNSLNPNATCPDGTAAQQFHVQSMTAALVADSVRTGAPVRVLQNSTYSLIQNNGRWYLGVRVGNGTADPLVGPLRSPADGGLQFQFMDGTGGTTTTAADVVRVRVTLRAQSDALTSYGDVVADSLTGLVAVRN